MKIEIMDQITLENDQSYLVCNTTQYNNKEYYLLVNCDDKTDIMIAYFDKEELVSVDDITEYVKVMGTFDTDKVIKQFSTEIEST